MILYCAKKQINTKDSTNVGLNIKKVPKYHGTKKYKLLAFPHLQQGVQTAT